MKRKLEKEDVITIALMLLWIGIAFWAGMNSKNDQPVKKEPAVEGVSSHISSDIWSRD